MMRFAVCTFLAVTLGVVSAAQTPSPPAAGDLRFEVASIKPSAPRTASGCEPPTCSTAFFQTLPGRFLATNMSVLDLLATAYSISQKRIVGPAWTQSERF